MGDIMRRVVTLFSVDGANQVRASMQQMSGGMNTFRGNLDTSNRSAGILNGQLRALSTTAKYMFSGAVIYGTMEMIRNLGEFQSKLGDISAIATGADGLPIVSSQLDALGSKLIDVSNRTTQPISDLQQGVLSLYSTIGKVPPNQAAKIMETMAEVANSSQSNIEDTTNALLSMMDAFGQGTGSLSKFGNEFQKVIQLSAGMPGSTYAQKLGVLSSSASLAGITPEEMGGFAIAATRSGGSPSTNMQYLAQFFNSISNPQTKKNQQELNSLGLNETERRKLGGTKTIMAFLAAVQKAGGLAGINKKSIAATDNALSIDDQSTASLQSVGITGGGADVINKAFGRLQSRRMAAILYKVFSTQQTAGTENQTIEQYIAQVMNPGDAAHQGSQRKVQASALIQSSNVMHNFGLEIGTAISPALKPIAEAITKVGSSYNDQNPWAQRGELAGAGVGLLGLIKYLRGASGVSSKLPRVGEIGAVSDVLTESGRGNTPLKPLYVAVVYSLAGGRGVFPTTAGGAGKAAKTAAEGETAAKDAAAAEKASKYAKVLKYAKILGPAAAIFASTETFGLTALAGSPLGIGSWASTRDRGLSKWQQQQAAEADATGSKLYKYLATGYTGAISSDIHYTNNPTPAELKIIDAIQDKKMTMTAGEALLLKLATTDQLTGAGVKSTGVVGKASVDVHLKDATGKTISTKTAVMDLFPNTTTTPPTQRAKPKTQRG